jgi:adenosine kinase
MENAGELSVRTVGACRVAIVSPNDPGAMLQYADECRTLGIPFIWDPGQQCARMSGDELRDGLDGAAIVICNDYEFELLRQKTGLDRAGVLARAAALVMTRGEHGCTVVDATREVHVAAVTPHRLVDPTGVGDAFRGGLLKGLAGGADLDVCARLGSVAATYALEHLGGQSHAYTLDEFRERYEQQFGRWPF